MEMTPSLNDLALEHLCFYGNHNYAFNKSYLLLTPDFYTVNAFLSCLIIRLYCFDYKLKHKVGH